MLIIALILEIPIMPIIPLFNFGKVCVAKSDTFELSEGNGEVRKRGGRTFDEKRVLDGWG